MSRGREWVTEYMGEPQTLARRFPPDRLAVYAMRYFLNGVTRDRQQPRSDILAYEIHQSKILRHWPHLERELEAAFTRWLSKIGDGSYDE